MPKLSGAVPDSTTSEGSCQDMQESAFSSGDLAECQNVAPRP